MTPQPQHGAPQQFHSVAHSLQALIGLSNEVERELVRLLGINVTDYRALTSLATSGPVDVSTLAHRIGASAATTTAILNRLEAAGYVQRDRTDRDRRRVTVSVTPAVFAEIMRLMGPLMGLANDEITSLPAQDQAVVGKFFGRLLALMAQHRDSLAAQERP